MLRLPTEGKLSQKTALAYKSTCMQMANPINMIRHFSSGNWLTDCREEDFLFEFLFSWPLKEKYSWKLLFN